MQKYAENKLKYLTENKTSNISVEKQSTRKVKTMSIQCVVTQKTIQMDENWYTRTYT